MHKMTWNWLVAVGLVAAQGVFAAEAAEAAAPAADSATGVGLTAKVGTLGLGADVTIGVNEYLGLRVQVNGASYSDSFEDDDGTIKGKIDWLTYGALLDWYPAGGGFRISGGGLANQNKVKLSADLTDTVELDDQEFWLSDLHGEATFNDLAPYLGIGYGNAVGANQRWHFSCDFGVMFQGEPKIEAFATASDPALQGEVDRALDREVKDIQDDADAFKYYPVISVGVAFKF